MYNLTQITDDLYTHLKNSHSLRRKRTPTLKAYINNNTHLTRLPDHKIGKACNVVTMHTYNHAFFPTGLGRHN